VEVRAVLVPTVARCRRLRRLGNHLAPAQPKRKAMRLPARMHLPAQRTRRVVPLVHPQSFPHASQRRREASASGGRRPLFRGRVTREFRQTLPGVIRLSAFGVERLDPRTPSRRPGLDSSQPSPQRHRHDDKPGHGTRTL
jgi:hypothetical protein